ncbi:hypothetical protein [Peterkaempfera bronchialis]|uniref:Uncharacterized protein n=1 Tax=Peterkaempfera bronchialis TaxID=2126346 RepID=A0A345SUA7_9ACTN|nr:hypothetical protein [Peterkaempfera bronchialis]AXI77312.1 hypothetical protein C7M71_007495 [Peterkaempfera bronchialis]
MAVVCSIVVGVLIVELNGGLQDGRLTLATVGAVLMASQTAHALMLKEAAAWLEERTSWTEPDVQVKEEQASRGPSLE